MYACDVDGLDSVETEAFILAPEKIFLTAWASGHPRIAVSDVGGEKFDEPAPGLGAGVRRQAVDSGLDKGPVFRVR